MEASAECLLRERIARLEEKIVASDKALDIAKDAVDKAKDSVSQAQIFSWITTILAIVAILIHFVK